MTKVKDLTKFHDITDDLGALLVPVSSEWFTEQTGNVAPPGMTVFARVITIEGRQQRAWEMYPDDYDFPICPPRAGSFSKKFHPGDLVLSSSGYYGIVYQQIDDQLYVFNSNGLRSIAAAKFYEPVALRQGPSTSNFVELVSAWIQSESGGF